MKSNGERLSSEIGHVLFMDLIAFSKMTMEEQARAAQELQEAVRATPEFQRAQARKELICLPTGDGMALIFFGDPVAPAQCALEISREAAGYPSLKLRMGIHSGPVSRATDITGKENASGSGINLAQRVMDCGDTSHILVSAASAETIGEFAGWADRLHELGEIRVKHDRPISLFNLWDDQVGNKAPPKQMAGPAPEADVKDKPAAKQAGSSGKVVLLYKRNVKPDEHVLALLEEQLRAEGYEVFIDRHMVIGVEWAVEIERQIRTSDAVIPLLSAASVRSEMLEFEVQTARDAAESQGGKPRLLPVRVNFADPLPDPLAHILDPIQYSLWHSEADDERLTAETIQSLRTPPKPSISSDRLEPVGGAVPLGSEFYIERPADKEFKAAISRGDSIVLVQGARQIGKTSLLARGLQHARELGVRVVLTDFQALNEEHLANPDSLLVALASALAVQLDLDALPRKEWDMELGASMNMEWFMRKKVLSAFPERLVWGMDEVDRLFSCSFASQVFGLFRSWHNRRSLEPTGPWSRLTLAIAYATEAHLFISDLNQSPFNVGTRLSLEDFTREQVADLNRRYGSPLRTPEELDRFHHLFGGHPYLVRRALDEMVTRKLGFDALEKLAVEDYGPFGDHLRRILVLLSRDAELTEMMRRALKGEQTLTPATFSRLRSAGVLIGDPPGDNIRPRCDLYRLYGEKHLL